MPKFPKQASRGRKAERWSPVHTPSPPVPPRIDPTSIRLHRPALRTPRQSLLVDSIRQNDLTYAIGPAGTGKTFLAAHCALESLKDGEVKRIVLSRPAVEAGEKLGFLPGDLDMKLDPFMRPLIEAIITLIGKADYEALRARDYIEVIPFAYIRGLNFKDTFLLLDECQNATPTQLKTALTRIGEGSTCVVALDPQQIDLDDPTQSAAYDLKRFEGVPGIGMVQFETSDVIRSRIVKTILQCY